MSDEFAKVREDITKLESEIWQLQGKDDDFSKQERVAMRKELAALREKEVLLMRSQGQAAANAAGGGAEAAAGAAVGAEAVNVQEEFMTNFRLWWKEASRPFQLFAGALTACKSVTKEVTYRGAPVVFWLAWLFFVGGIVLASVLVRMLGAPQLFLGYITGAGSVSLLNTAAGYLKGSGASTPPLGQMLLAISIGILFAVVSLLIVAWLVLLSAGMVVCIAGMYVARAATQAIYVATGVQQAVRVAEQLRRGHEAALSQLLGIWRRD